MKFLKLAKPFHDPGPSYIPFLLSETLPALFPYIEGLAFSVLQVTAGKFILEILPDTPVQWASPPFPPEPIYSIISTSSFPHCPSCMHAGLLATCITRLSTGRHSLIHWFHNICSVFAPCQMLFKVLGMQQWYKQYLCPTSFHSSGGNRP